MKKNKLLGGNWKMSSSLQTFDIVKNFKKNFFDGNDVFIAVPFPYIHTARMKFPEYIKVGAQDCSRFRNGPYTGEVSAAMVKEMGAEYIIIGHSERRKWFGETSAVILEKIRNARSEGLNIILCIGEDEECREDGKYLDELRNQLLSLREEMCGEDIDIAYEPVWAIGTGKVPTNAQIKEIVSNIKKWGKDMKFNGRVIYGGSVSMLNCQAILDVEEVDGFLIGGTSLKMDFCMISSEMGTKK
ncbi:triosephosphate isomerase [Encephalitozoon hellem ATCC 50504]|uniref:Triosephosphate isomerase n=1 Tax=Encephalitozoon hellem TaxID=27973 RepID=A0A9Q9FCJ8_ENCHE|nr:triosephosphate isomerase [Encephalitozoon hellem ATCC 50504]AFM99287.1 triosephosphate isomerase [Encephalitozoon hellem ATCC 50504]UTX44290.1 triosephosphate isomerase [Encephalitozoon hellem]WEL39789.1 triosephosphate isomerase [Encephalitozoon hellem]|eukprot:XP_003888268.1 triosephosphate isomerase [Encephalitozoon hellem ATCC 50504]